MKWHEILKEMQWSTIRDLFRGLKTKECTLIEFGGLLLNEHKISPAKNFNSDMCKELLDRVKAIMNNFPHCITVVPTCIGNSTIKIPSDLLEDQYKELRELLGE